MEQIKITFNLSWHIFSGSNTTIKPFEKSSTFDADGTINFDGDGILRKVAVDISLYRDWETDRKSTRLNSSHSGQSRMPSSA